MDEIEDLLKSLGGTQDYSAAPARTSVYPPPSQRNSTYPTSSPSYEQQRNSTYPTSSPSYEQQRNSTYPSSSPSYEQQRNSVYPSSSPSYEQQRNSVYPSSSPSYSQEQTQPRTSVYSPPSQRESMAPTKQKTLSQVIAHPPDIQQYNSNYEQEQEEVKRMNRPTSFRPGYQFIKDNPNPSGPISYTPRASVVVPPTPLTYTVTQTPQPQQFNTYNATPTPIPQPVKPPNHSPSLASYSPAPQQPPQPRSVTPSPFPVSSPKASRATFVKKTPGGGSPGNCYACRQPIIGDNIQALGKVFHPEHFQCSSCSRAMGTSNLYERDANIYCESCFMEQFTARCAHCSEPIVGTQFTALGKKWHPHHFVCTQCSRPFDGGKYFEKDGLPFCEADFYHFNVPKCGECQQPIKGDSIQAMGTFWCPEHFACQVCKTSFQDTNYFELGGKPYCSQHYHQQTNGLCGGCGKGISGRCINAFGRNFHPEHFVCAFCMLPLALGNFLEKENKPYCRKCYTSMFP